ncbi:MAG: phosphotransferase family protein [Pseudomonadales bacterium]
MTIVDNDLPAGLLDWVAGAAKGEVIRLQRHVARREAWIIDLKMADGSTLEGFLRLQRDTAGDLRRLERETRIMQAIAENDIPAPAVYAWSDEFRAALFERDPGRADIDKVEDTSQQRAVMEDFIKVVARFHKLDTKALGLNDIMLPEPQTPRDCALSEVDELVKQWQFFLDQHTDPLLSYCLQWLERFAPESVARVSLLQGDTGPVNFMFQGRQVSGVIDWECGHYGDPLEDLGNIMVREFWNPSGGLTDLFNLYEQESGVPYERFRAQYYAVQQNVRGMIPIHYVSLHGNQQESLAWYLCYRYMGDRATAEMLAMAMNVQVEKPGMPDEITKPDVLARSAMQMQKDTVLTSLSDQFAVSRAKDVSALIECMDRRNRYGQAIASAELDDLSAVLGKRPQTIESGRLAFVEKIHTQGLNDEVIISTLLRKAYREEWLHKPAVNLYPDRQWSEID